MFATTVLGDRFEFTYECEFWAVNDARTWDRTHVVTVAGELDDMTRLMNSPQGATTCTRVARVIAIPGEPSPRREYLTPWELGNLENPERVFDAMLDDANAVARWGQFIDAQATYSDA